MSEGNVKRSGSEPSYGVAPTQVQIPALSPIGCVTLGLLTLLYFDGFVCITEVMQTLKAITEMKSNS
jgi:hypothetical protein